MWRQRHFTEPIARFYPVVLLVMLSLAVAGFGQDPSGRPSPARDLKGVGGSKSGKNTSKNTSKPDPQPITVTLTILTTPPESVVLLNGESRGTTNAEGKLQIEKLPLGRYSVEVRKEGFNPQLRGFDAGAQAPTLVFKLDPNLEDFIKQFDSLVSSGKLAGPDSPNAMELFRDLSARFPDRPELARLRGVLAAKFMEPVAPVINQTATNWRAVKRDEIVRTLDSANRALELKQDDTRIQSEAAYLKGALALFEWQRGGSPAKPAGENDGGLSVARAEFEKALKLQESFAAARYLLGVVLLHSGDAAGAEASFARTIQLEPRWPFAQTSLGAAYYAQGRYKDAIDAFRRAADMDQSQSAAIAGLGLARWAKGEKDGVKDVERAMKVDSAAALPHLYLGIIYSQSKNKKELARAEEELKKAIEMNPQNIEFQNNVAERILADLQSKKKK